MNKKGFVLFPLLIVIIALIVFNLALVGLILKSNEKMQSLNKIYPAIDYKWHIESEKFLEESYTLAYNKALKDFLSKKINNNCNSIAVNNRNYFSLRECKIDKNLFLEMFKENFDSYMNSFANSVKIYFNSSPVYNCTYNTKVECKISFENNFDFSIFNVSIKKENYFVKEIDLNYLDKIEILRMQILDKLTKGEAIDKKMNGFDIIQNKQDGLIYITIFTEKRFLIEENLQYKPFELNLVYKE